MRALGLGLLVLLAACGTEDEEMAGELAIPGDPNADVSGPAVEVTGSSTVYPFTSAVAGYFADAYPGARRPEVTSTGTNAGIGAFCAGGPGAPDIADASRRMTVEEFRTCRENGVTNIRELTVGLDGIALVEARPSAPEDMVGAEQAGDAEENERFDLTPRQIYEALAATSADGSPNETSFWSDISTGLPERPISFIVPPSTSGTRQQFEELVMLRGCRNIPRLAEAPEERCTTLRSDDAVSEGAEDDNAIVAAVSGNPDAIGVVGYSYLESNSEIVQPISLDRFIPNEATIMGGGYPASRRLYLYVNADRFTEKPALGVFVDTFLAEEVSGDQGLLVETGFVPVPVWSRDALMEARNRRLEETDL
ncbi:hypothetical protein B5C34_06060 [Pacificimonas flava]|uniref:PBP domain-containing protein n=2 Tax=Pacificimonas TaxID=1960290 RepID=A0A219B5L7_9SPHN|nr:MULTISPECIES: substrate-binding domain-containing protein [Pacificimonas]MBZ6377212.1 substrate-binding domain-containing protein [Pacificimonas aurantium]OWV33068.1 hypothetical protein B5C34_06060 [Pacificimonas flava]